MTESNLAALEKQLNDDAEKMNFEVGDVGRAKLSPNDQKRLSALEDALKKGSVDPRSTMGGIFRSELANDKEGSIEYAKLNRQDAAQFRLQWLKQSYDTFQKEKVHTKAWRRVDATKGKYMSASQLVNDDGGWSDPAAVRGAYMLMLKCLAMGKPWTKRHPQTNRILYLKLSFEFEELFEESWTEYHRELKAGTIKDGGHARALKGAPETKPADDDEDEDAAKKAGKKSTTPRKDKPENVENTQFNQTWKQGIAVRKVLLNAITAAQEVNNQIDSSDSWDFARNPQNQGQLKSMMANLRSSMSNFHKAFMSEEPAVIRKAHTKEDIMVELRSLIGFKGKATELADFVKTLQRRKCV